MYGPDGERALRFLERRGADLTITDRYKKTPQMYIKKRSWQKD